jgi:zinc transporter ZupT
MMEALTAKYVIWAVLLGAISAFSLPLGSLVGLKTRPRAGIISVLAAFGAGALIAALAVELVAPTVLALDANADTPLHGNAHTHFYALIMGALVGGCLFVILDRIVNAYGGFLRKTSNTVAYFTARTHRRKLKVLENIAPFPLVKDLPVEHVNRLVDMLRPVTFAAGEVIFKEGEASRGLYFLIEGRAEAANSRGLTAEVNAGSEAGIISLVMDVVNPGTLTCRDAVMAYSLSRENFEQLRSLSPEFDSAARDLTTQRLESIGQLVAERDARSITWIQEAEHALKTGSQIPDASQLRMAKEEHKGAPLAIWLGILLDGIPESFVIGAGLLVLLQSRGPLAGPCRFGDVIPYTLIAGLFLSNFPEAFASSANMSLLGWSKKRIFLLWFSLMVVTALGAGGGYMLAGSISRTWLSFAEGLAAGAMLTMIAAAMIPEAVHMGRANTVGLGTLVGFLAAISFKLLE